MFSFKLTKNLFIAATVATVPFVVVVDTVAAESILFNDVEKATKDMQWAVNSGYMDGYVNQKHPVTGKKGNWLHPTGTVTEADMLMALLRYKLGVEGFNKYSKDLDYKNPHESAYTKGFALKIITKGYAESKSGSNKYQKYKAYQNELVTRGDLAKALVSMYYLADVNLKEAIEFMYINKLTAGIDPSKGQTVKNYGADTRLTRAHLAVFLKKYDTLLQSENVVDIAKYKLVLKKYDTFRDGIFTVEKQTAKTDDLVGKKIKTKFGERAYGTKTQAEYDEVMKVVEGLKIDKGYLDRMVVNPDKNLEQAFNEYKAGKRGITNKRDPAYREGTNLMLVTIERSTPDSLMQHIKTYDDYVLLMHISQLNITLSRFSKPAPKGYDPTSAHDLFIKNWDDCTSYAYGVMAIYDQMGIDGFVLHSPGRVHDYYVINLHGKWYAGGEEVTTDFLRSGDRIFEAPNNGIKSLPAHLRSIYNPLN